MRSVRENYIARAVCNRGGAWVFCLKNWFIIKLSCFYLWDGPFYFIFVLFLEKGGGGKY